MEDEREPRQPAHWDRDDVAVILSDAFCWDAPRPVRVVLMRVGYEFGLQPSQWLPKRVGCPKKGTKTR